MEAVGVAASIIAIIQLTVACLKLSTRVVGPSAHNSARLRSITTTLYAFNGTINNLKANLEIYEEDQARLETLEHLTEPLARCKEALELLNARMQSNNFFTQYITGSRFDKKLDGCLRILEDARTLLELSLQCDQRVLINAVETYVRSIAEETRDIKSTVTQTEQLLTNVDSSMKESFDLARRLHDEQFKSLTHVHENIRDLGDEIKEQGAQTNTREQFARRSEGLAWLSDIDVRSNHLDALQLREPGTGQWLLDQDLFKSWEEGSIQSIWLHGMPGAGKTLLSAAVIDHLEKSSNGNVAYFYFDFKDSVKQSAESMLQSIAAQIEGAKYATMLSPAMEQLYSTCQKGSRRRATHDEVMNLISALSSTTSKFYIVLDALDECSDRTKLLQTIIALKKAGVNFNLFVASRRESEITESLTENGFRPISILDDAVTRDIGLYINSVLQNDENLRRLPGELKSHIKTTLMDGAKSMFRWVKCQIDSIRPLKRAKAIREALKTLPKTLDETYERIILQLIEAGAEDNLTLLRRIFVFVAFSMRPMTVAELAQAVVVEIGAHEADEDAAFHNPEDLLALCYPLITVSPHTGLLGFVHYSVQEFLLSNRLSNKESTIRSFALNEKSGHAEIAQVCLSFINLNDFLPGPCTTYEKFRARMEQHPFLNYAADFWPHHAHVENVEEDVSDLIAQLFIPQKNPKLASMLQACSNRFTYRPADGEDYLEFLTLRGKPPAALGNMVNSLAIASLLGFDSVLKPIVESGADIDADGTEGGNALQSAVYHQHLTTAKILVDLGADINHAGRGKYGTALMTAIRLENQKLIDYFFDLGADVTVSAGFFNTALHVAAYTDDIPTMRRLLGKGADINWGEEESTSFGTNNMWVFKLKKTPLEMAASNGRIEAALFLIGSGASLSGISIVKWANRLSSRHFIQPLPQEKAARLVQGLSDLGYHIEVVQDENIPEFERPTLAVFP